MSSEERDQTSMKNSRTPTFQSVISTAKISDMVLDEKIVEVIYNIPTTDNSINNTKLNFVLFCRKWSY